MTDTYTFPEGSYCLAKKHLTPQNIKRLQHLTTQNGCTLKQMIQSGIENPDSHIGIYAGDAECYTLFDSVFAPIITEYHKLSAPIHHISSEQYTEGANPDPDNTFILSTRIRTARNIRSYPFTPVISLEKRLSLERHIISVLAELSGENNGTYTPFTPDPESHFFPKGDRFQDAAGINRDFPKGRGIYQSHDKVLRIWLNEEDHLRIILQQTNASVFTLFKRFTALTSWLNKKLIFAYSEKLGYMGSCPTNIGTAMRAGVHIRLKKLGEKQSLLHAIAKKHDLQIRGTGGEKTKVIDHIYDVSNQRRLGLSEVKIITSLNTGLEEMIQTEKSL